MRNRVNRREFLWHVGLGGFTVLGAQTTPARKVRIGFVGVGSRGGGHVQEFLKVENTEIKAVCDIDESRIQRMQALVTDARRPKPEGYSGGPTDYKRLCAREDLDLIVNCTPWELHAPVSVEAMKSGKHTAIEVPAAVTIEECWQLVETSEKTGRHCVILENCCYDRFELMALNMVRKGLLGELVHAECGYLHDLRELKTRYRDGKRPWRLEHTLRRNGDVYPTHGLGPVAQCMNINRGNLFDHMVSMASKVRSLHAYAVDKFGPDSPQAKLEPALGDVVTSTIRTRAGETIIVVHDTNTPRPYSRKVLVQGTKGLMQKYPSPLIHIDGKSPGHDWEDLEKYAGEWEHPLWRRLSAKAEGAGHGGMDFIQNYRLIECLARGEAPDMDVYDAAAWSAVGELSEKSIASKSKTVDFPDFTRGKWKDRPPLPVIG